VARSITLKPGGRCTVPDVVVFIDVEPSVSAVPARPGSTVHKFSRAVASICRLERGCLADKGTYELARPEMLWGLLSEFRDTHKATWVFAHNLGYDLTLIGFWDWLRRSGAQLVSAVLDDPPTMVTIRWHGRLVKFVDVLNYWRLPLTDLASATGLTLSQSSNVRGLQSTDLSSCSQHVEVIEQCIIKLIALLSEINLCSLRPTAASLSWATFIKSFLQTSISVSLDERERSLARRSYFGGRSLVNASGYVKHSVTALDVNSLYPYVMQANQYPCKVAFHKLRMRPGDLKACLRYYDAICECTLSGSRYPYPCRVGGRPDFVRGVSTAVLAGEELRHAADSGDIREVGETYCYYRADLFSGFVKHWYRKKCEAVAAGNRPDALMAKLMLNCLHGKFAQRGRRWQPKHNVMSHGYYSYWWHRVAGRGAPVRCRSIAGVVESQEDGPEPLHAFPAIAACVTAAGRVVLNQDIEYAGEHNVYYADTDSIHTNSDGLARLSRMDRLDDEKIGHYRTVAAGDFAIYYGRQHYAVGDKFVCTSIKPTAIEVADGVYLQDAYTGVERCLEDGTLDSVQVSQRIVDLSERTRHAKRQSYTTGAYAH